MKTAFAEGIDQGSIDDNYVVIHDYLTSQNGYLEKAQHHMLRCVILNTPFHSVGRCHLHDQDEPFTFE